MAGISENEQLVATFAARAKQRMLDAAPAPVEPITEAQVKSPSSPEPERNLPKQPEPLQQASIPQKTEAPNEPPIHLNTQPARRDSEPVLPIQREEDVKPAPEPPTQQSDASIFIPPPVPPPITLSPPPEAPTDPAERVTWAKARQEERALDRSSARIKQHLAEPSSQDDLPELKSEPDQNPEVALDTTTPSVDAAKPSPLERMEAEQNTPENRRLERETNRHIRQVDNARARRGLPSLEEPASEQSFTPPQRQVLQANDPVAATILAEVKALAKGQADIMQKLDTIQQQKQVAVWGP